MSKVEDSYGFECPIHGFETQVFCHRAFNRKNIYKWRRISSSVHGLTDKDKIKVEKIIERERNYA